MLAKVPLAGMSYLLLVAAGASSALVQEGTPIYLGLTVLLTAYAGVVIVNLNWNAFLFVGHRSDCSSAEPHPRAFPQC